MKTYTILDTRGWMLKAFHAHQYEKTWQNGLALFVEVILNPLMTAPIPPQNIISTWDAGNDHRLALSADYKKARLEKDRDPEISEQLKIMKEKTISLLAYLGIKSVHVPGEEADDLIALLCDRLEADHFIVRTVDNDLLQLVSPKVSVWVDKDLMTPVSKYKGSIPVSCVLAYKSLVGDPSDGYGGVPKLGAKRFAQLLVDYKEDGVLQIMEGLKANDWSMVQGAYEATKDSTLNLLLEHWTKARASLALATLAPECCYGNYKGKVAKKPIWTARVPNQGKVIEILKEIGMAPEIGKYNHVFPRSLLAQVSNHEQLAALGEKIVESEVVSWDYESTDKLKHKAFQDAKKRGGGTYVDVLSQKISGISVNFGTHMEQTVYLPVDHKDTGNFPTEWLQWLLRVLDATKDRSVVQNAAFELTVSKTNLMPDFKAPYDTAIMSSYVDENEESGLKKMSLRYLGYQQASYEETTQGRDMCDLTGQEVLSYGCDDSLVTSHLFSLFRIIMQLEGSWDFYRSYEVDPAVDDMTDFVAGQEIDYREMGRQAQESKELIASSTENIRELLRHHSNLETEQEYTRRALILYGEWLATERFKAEGDPKKLQEIEARLWAKAWRACFYEEFSEQIEVPEFSSTPTMLNKVIAAICQGAPKLKKANGPGVEEYESELAAFTESTQIDDATLARLDKFMSLLFKARKKLGAGSRKGANYDALAAFCGEIINGADIGKVIKTGTELNIGSTPQMQGLLYGVLGLPVRKRSKVTKGSLRDVENLSGAPATGLKAIAAAFVYDLQDESDWRRDLLFAYRTVAIELQNQALYYNTYPLWKHPRDGRIHPQVRNCGTVTRRPAGNDPNVLQVSKRDGAKIRRCYLPGDYGDGQRVVVSADFANQELVITAAESRDPVMLDAFMSEPRKDLHSVTSLGYAHMLLPRMGIDCAGKLDYDSFMAMRRGDHGEELQKACNEIRNKYSKAVNFLIAYLGGYTTLAGNLLISNDLAQQLMNSTFDMYKRLAPWQQEVIEFAKVHGFSQTAYGNRRHAPADLWSKDDGLRTRVERQVVNAVVQGGAADQLKVVRQSMFDRKMHDKYRLRAVKPVYDEITASVPIDAVLDYCEELVECMSITPPNYPVSMKVDLSIGNNWGEQIELESTSREEVERVLDELNKVEEAA